MINVKGLILGMMLVTMFPRIIPFYLFDTEKLPPFVRTFLGYVPYTVLGALVLPGSLSALSGSWIIPVICLGAAWIVGWYKGGLILPVTSAVATAVLIKISGVL
jgi:branched-subunit amino acid transport protein